MTGKRVVDMAIISLSLLGTAAALAVLIYSEFIYERPLPIDKEELEKLLVDSKAGVYPETYKLKRIIVNLQSRTKRLRFLEVEVHLSPFKKNKRELIEAKEALIKDAIIEVAGRMDPAELNSVSGKILLENRLKKSINKILGGSIIKDIFFWKFVVQ